MNSQLGPDDVALAKKLLSFLRGDLYQLAKEAYVYYEVKERLRSREAAYEMRDALDHLVRASAQDISRADQERLIASAEEHLLRAALEPIEAAAEDKLLEVSAKRRRLWLRRLLYSGIPPDHVIEEKFPDIATRIKSGRLDKSDKLAARDCYQNFQEAYARACELSETLSPTRASELARVLVFILTAVVGGLVSLGLQRLIP